MGIRSRYGRLRGWIESKSAIVRIGVAVLAVMGYLVSAALASALQDTTSNVVLIVLGLPAIILAVTAVYVLAVVAWSFVTGVRSRLPV